MVGLLDSIVIFIKIRVIFTQFFSQCEIKKNETKIYYDTFLETLYIQENLIYSTVKFPVKNGQFRSFIITLRGSVIMLVKLLLIFTKLLFQCIYDGISANVYILSLFKYFFTSLDKEFFILKS